MNSSVYVDEEFEFRPERAVVQAERNMWLAVVSTAVWEISTAKTMRSASQVLNWFTAQDTHVGSFRWICEQLELDPSYWRKRAQFVFDIRITKGRKAVLVEKREETI